MSRVHGLHIPPQLVLLLKTLIHVEGLGRELYPALDIWSLAKPLLTQWMNDRIGPKALLKRVKEDTPILLAGLPELPQLIFDALSQQRLQGQWQRRQLDALTALQADLRVGRRQDFIAWFGVIGGGLMALASADALPWSAPPALLGWSIAVIVVSAFWRVTRA